MKTPIPNPGYTRTTAILREANYRCIREFKTVLPRGCIASEERFEVWAGPKGIVLLQVWKDGNGVATYADWGLGHTFEELKAVL